MREEIMVVVVVVVVVLPSRKEVQDLHTALLTSNIIILILDNTVLIF
jgi:hypothetical protein